MWWITRASGSPLIVSQIVLLSILPGIFFGMIAGKFSDKFNQKWIIVITDLLQGLVILWITIVAFRRKLHLYHFYITAMLSSLLISFFRPAIFTAIPRLVAKEDLVVANSLHSLSKNFSNILGPALSGIIVATLGVEIAFLINALSFLISAFAELFIQMPESQRKHKEEKKNKSFIADIKESFVQVLNIPIARYGIIIFGMVNFLLTPLNLITFVAEKLNVGANGYGILQTSEGIGLMGISMILGTEFVKKRLKPGRMNVLAISLLAGSIIIVGLSNIFILTCLAQLLIGIAVGMAAILLNSSLQTHIDKECLGMFVGIRNMVMDFLMPLGLLLNGFFANLYSVNLILVVSGILMFSNLVWILKFNGAISKKESQNVDTIEA